MARRRQQRCGDAGLRRERGQGDPAVLATLDKFFQPVIYMNSADYTAYAERTFKAEKATIERLGLSKKA